MSLTRRRWIADAAGAAVTIAWPLAGAHASRHFPSRPIRLVVAYAPGSASDLLARAVAAAMGPLLGQPIVVDNRAGASGVMGTKHGADAAPDGYTMTMVSTSSLFTVPEFSDNARYRADRSFVFVAGLALTPYIVVTAATPEGPKSLAELTGRLAASPGSFGSPGVGTVAHLIGELLLKRASVKAVHAPYRSSSAALADVAAGQLLFSCDTVVAALPLIRAGKLRALAVTSAKRVPALPEVPTAAEAGLSGFMVTGWLGLAVPARTPREIVDRLSGAAMKALESAEVSAQLANQQMEAMALPSAAFGDFIRTSQPFWSDFIRQVRTQPGF